MQCCINKQIKKVYCTNSKECFICWEDFNISNQEVLKCLHCSIEIHYRCLNQFLQLKNINYSYCPHCQHEGTFYFL